MRQKRQALLVGILLCILVAVTAFIIYSNAAKTPITKPETSTVTTLASGLDEPRFVAVSGGYVYFTELTGGRIRKIDVQGHDMITLASGLRWPMDIAVSGDYVYFTEHHGQTVKKVGINGGEVITLARNLHAPYGIVVSDGYVYYTDMDWGT